MAGDGLGDARQAPRLPLAPLNGLDALLLAYIAQAAACAAAPHGPCIHVHIGVWAMLATYAAMAATIAAGASLARSRRSPPPAPALPRRAPAR